MKSENSIMEPASACFSHSSEPTDDVSVDLSQQVFGKLLPEIQRALIDEGYTKPTPIQEEAIPHILEGRDLIGCAQTGTGKTAAFTLPILQYLIKETPSPVKPGRPKVLVLAPTRELAAQIGDSISKYGSYLKLKHAVIFGGVSKVPQIQMLKQGVEIIVATPGRLLDLMQQKAVHLDQVEFFVLDEADRMLDMGFIPDIRKIIKSLPMNKQTLFFSATMEADIGKLARTLVHKPAYVTIDPGQPTVERIVQSICFIDKKNKDALLCSLIKDQNMKRVIVFTQMKHVANKVTQRLIEKGIRAMAIHGNKSQAARIKALESFRAGSCHVLVATDIAARGIDIDNIGHVINYDLPNEPETYVHRIGRTARAGKEGEAFSFCSAEERNYLRMIEALQRKEIPIMEHPFHCDLAQNATGADAKPKPKAQRNPLQKGGKRFAKAKNSMRDTRFNKNGLQIRSRKSQ